MKKAIGAIGVMGVATAGIALAPPVLADVDPGSGAASVTLTKCPSPANPTDTFNPACSYVSMSSTGGLLSKPIVNLTAPAAVSWANGSTTDKALAFPGSGQTWQAIEKLSTGAELTMNPVDITGGIDSAGVVTMSLPYNILIEGSAQKCTLTGTVELSSATTDSAGKATGANWDPATGAFAVAGTGAAPTQAPGSVCTNVQANVFDLTKPIGFYFVGTMTLPPPDAPQTATVKVAKKVKKSGKTILLKKAVATNIGQKATAKVSWSPKKSAKGKQAKYAKLTTKKSGKLILRTKGASKKLYVKLTLSAPAQPGYKAFTYTKVWKAK